MVERWSNGFTLFALRSQSFLVIFGRLAIREGRNLRIPPPYATPIRSPSKRVVAGSNPAGVANKINPLRGRNTGRPYQFKVWVTYGVTKYGTPTRIGSRR